MNIGTKNKSWWYDNGIGCRVTNDSWNVGVITEASRAIPPEAFVEDCILKYHYVEIIHAGVQIILAVSYITCFKRDICFKTDNLFFL